MFCAEQAIADPPRHADTDDNALSGDPGHSAWLQEYASYIERLSLNFCPCEEGGLEVDTLMRADGWPVNLDKCLDADVVEVVRAITSACIAAIIDWKIRTDCMGCAYNSPSQRRHSCLYGPSLHHYETHYDDICLVLHRDPLCILLKTVIKNTTGKSVWNHTKLEGVFDSVLCDLLSETNVIDKLSELRSTKIPPEHQSKINEATRLWRRTLDYRLTTYV